MKEIYFKLQPYIVTFGIRILSAVLIFFIGRLIARYLAKVIEKILARRKMDLTVVKFTGSLVYAALVLVVILASMSQLGIQTTSFVAILGAASLAVGLALQGALSNFAAGFMMILLRPVRVGDFIEAGGAEGFVEHVNIFMTHLRTLDSREVLIPNGKIMSGNIVNHSSLGKRRLDMVFGVSYGDDIDRVKSAIFEVLNSFDYILNEPEAMVGVLALSNSSVDFAVRPWVSWNNYWKADLEIREAIKKKFDELDITIPFPQLDVHKDADPVSGEK
ncbi:MAG: mechanosensitive ion channel [Deltaproteobacteria bacterium]|nr:mechanosensitive ion channel [Deltaproteobacteria bacterium]